MKTMFKISIAANLVMFGCLVFLFKNQSPPTPTAPVQTDSESGQAAAVAVATPPQPESKPFRWSQLESTDYRQYIANLRGIGCPEQTIRDLVTVDVDSVYAPQRAQLEQKSKSPFAPQQTIAAELKQLQDQEAWTLASLLGTQIAATNLATDDAPPPSRAVRQKPGTGISLPLVFQDVDPAALKLNNTEVQAINGLRQKFMEQIGGANQDPNDPAYLERWQKAQPEIDSDMRGMIGVNAFQDYQLAARASGTK
jgi:hypothetical protein